MARKRTITIINNKTSNNIDQQNKVYSSKIIIVESF